MYGIGNFVFNSPGRYRKRRVDPFSLIARLIIEERDLTLRLYPIFTDNRVTGYRSRFADRSEFEQVHDALAQEGLRTSKDHFGLFLELSL